MLQLQVRYFSRLRDLTSRTTETFLVDPGATVNDAVTAIMCKHPELVQLRSSLLIARNNEYAGPDETLSEGDTIDIMPPVSGG